jgi:hypothetical protein
MRKKKWKSSIGSKDQSIMLDFELDGVDDDGDVDDERGGGGEIDNNSR